ncbi:MAG: S9 family peptidase [Deltaproteobacteria bacterium]|nr:S9 family peptidase [Deltaproteobacteria bacterium]
MKQHLIVLSLLAACGGTKSAPVADPVEPVLADPESRRAEPPKPPEPPAPAVAKGHPKTDLIPRAVLFGNPERAGVQVSHDGKHLSWLAPKDGVMNIWVAPIDKLDQARAITAETTRPIRTYFWAFTNKHLLYMQDTGGNEDFHVFRADLEGPNAGKPTDLTPIAGVRASVADMHEKQPTTLLVSMNDRDKKVFDVHKVDLLTGKRELVVQNDDNLLGFTFDNTMRVRLGTKKTADGSTQILTAETKAGKTTWKPFETIAFEDSDTTNVVAFAPDNKSLYFTESRGRDTAALVQLDLASKKQKVLAEDARADAGGMLFHPKKHHLQAVAFEYDRKMWKVLDRSIQRDLDALAKLDGGEVNVGSRTLDDKTWIVVTTSEQRPQRYYRWDRTKQKATFLFAAQPELEKQPLVKMWPVEIKARDGLTLVSYLTLPAHADANADGKADKPVPMVLLVHGGPWARDTWGYNPQHQLLANRGYAVLSVNFRGSTGFGKQFLNAGNLQWGKTAHDDLLDAVEWAAAQQVAPKDKICIMGGSYGGYATLAGLAMTPDVFACGVDIVGPSNLLTLLATIPSYWTPMIARLHARVGNPETAEGKALLIAASPLTHAAKIKRPLLIGQGANDPRVKQAESEQIVAAMTEKRIPVTYVLFPDEGHGFARPENRIAFFAVTEAFLSAHLGGFYQPITADEIKSSTMQIKTGKEGIPGLP